MNNVTILGSTGSIGDNTLKVISNLKEQCRVFGLSARQNVKKLAQQAKEFSPFSIAIRDEEKVPLLRKNLPKTGVRLLSGLEGLNNIASDERVDTVVVAMSGIEAIFPVLRAIEKRKKIAIANKESIVMAGEIISQKINKYNAEFIPVDSEHNAIYQCLKGYELEEVDKLILTASGGPFINLSSDKFFNITPEQAISHPKWNMGKKISVDSATLMNKALEIVEATHLFNVSAKSIKILVHPEAIIHSMVEFVDRSVIALLSQPDMRLAIQYALTYPKRYGTKIKKLNFSKLKSLTFLSPDLKKFPALKLGYKAATEKGTLPAVMNAANEVAVDYFLKHKLKFTHIVPIVEEIMGMHNKIVNPCLEEIISADKWARFTTKELIQGGE